MNEPTEFAAKTTGNVTAKALLACLKVGGDSLSLHGEAAFDRASWSDSFVFTVSSTKRHGKYLDKNRAETTTELSVPGWVSNGHTDREIGTYDGRSHWRAAGVHRPTKGFWYLAGNETLRDVLEILPGNAQVAFHVYLDAGTTEGLIGASTSRPDGLYKEEGIHSDHLYLIVTTTERGKERVRKFLINIHTSAHNTARFGYR